MGDVACTPCQPTPQPNHDSIKISRVQNLTCEFASFLEPLAFEHITSVGSDFAETAPEVRIGRIMDDPMGLFRACHTCSALTDICSGWVLESGEH